MSARFIARHPMTASRGLGDEMIVISGGDSRLFTLNDVGATIWSAADGSASIDAIVARVCEAFDIDTATAVADTTAFVDALVEQGILVASDAPIAHVEADRS